MQLEIKNIGKVKNANITIDGITVIAGENNTGKSTIGKALFSLFHTFSNADQKIKKEKIDAITLAIISCAYACDTINNLFTTDIEKTLDEHLFNSSTLNSYSKDNNFDESNHRS